MWPITKRFFIVVAMVNSPVGIHVNKWKTISHGFPMCLICNDKKTIS